MRRIRVLIVEDSLVERELLIGILSADPEIEVLGTVNSGAAALAFLAQQKPDVITMDITMPHMDGYETTRRIMERHPLPIVIVSGSWDPQEVKGTFRAMEAGAVAGVGKPSGLGHQCHEEEAHRLVQMVKSMAEVKVVRRWARYRRTTGMLETSTAPPPDAIYRQTPMGIQLVAIGSSTGGPAVLQVMLARLQKDFAVPIMIAQHIAPGFLEGLVKWLGQTTGHAVHIATAQERLLPGRIYLAPDGFHMGVKRGGVVILSKDVPEHGMRPAVSYLFRSVASAFGKHAVGVLLTGMGRDGAEELKIMKDCGAVTIAQDEESSVVFGMPGEAVKLGGASYVLPPEKIAAMLNSIVESGQFLIPPNVQAE